MSTFADEVMTWADNAWDESRGLLWNPPGSLEDAGLAARTVHMVPQSAWYAVGLLSRGQTARAERVLEQLCALQYDWPGTPWHGTFAMFAESPQPEDGAVQWVDYDPNWRQFVGTTFGLILRTFDVSPSTGEQMQTAIGRAVDGEPRDRVAPSYSNIALMRAWLERDESYAASVVRCFDEHGAFAEYGSPTYYGIDLYALALWRLHPPSPHFKTWGERLWRELWADIARWWHPRMRNLCGPYTRAYGMDMARYVGLLGLWMPEPVAPNLRHPFDHSHDVLLAPVVDLLQTESDQTEGDQTEGDQTESDQTESDQTESECTDQRLVRQSLPNGRLATGWLSADVMVGGETGGRTSARGQYHPATVHWLLDDGSTGWLRLRHRGPLWATAGEGSLTVEVHDHSRDGRSPVMIESSHSGMFQQNRWVFPARTIDYDGPPADGHGVIDAGGGDQLRLQVRAR